MTDQLARNNELLERLVKRHSLGYKFLAGIVQALGATLGLAILFALISNFLSRVELVPLIGGWLSDVANNAIGNINLPTN